MKLKIKNIGKISHATIELNGITIIAGPNDSAKSTIGKVLYSVFNSFYNLEEKIHEGKVDSILRQLANGLNLSPGFISRVRSNRVLSNLLLEYTTEYNSDYSLLKRDLLNLIQENSITDDLNSKKIDEVVQSTIKILELPKDRILENIITENMNAEFNNQVNNIYHPEEVAEISLTIRKEKTTIQLQNNKVKSVSNKYHLSTEVIYIDDPYILDGVGPNFIHLFPNRASNHKQNLRLKLLDVGDRQLNIIDDLLMSDRIELIENKINEINDGHIVQTKGEYGYKGKKHNAVLNLQNVSTGLKTFIIIKTLLTNGSLEQNGVLILDEPEIHLHPKWQLVLAEIIVLIQKELSMHILLNTHSPYFLRAIEVYSAKHEIADKCNYYLSENNEQTSTFKNVTNHTDLIYQKLAAPLEELQQEEG